MKSIPYFPGCSAEGTSKDFEVATQEVFQHLGLALNEVQDWACCGASSAHFVDRLLSVALPARTLNLVKKSGGSEVAVSCAACFSRLKTAAHELEEDEKLREQVSEVLEEPYQGGVAIRHVLDVLLNDIGREQIKKAVVNPLKGLKVVCYYGCLLVRPPKVLKFDDAEDPSSIDTIMALTGATTKSWPCKTDCCGASLTLSRADLVQEVSRKILVEARDVGADLIVVACPLCQANLDMRQQDLRANKRIDFSIPVVFFTQLLGLSLGISPAKLRMKRLMNEIQPKIKRTADKIAGPEKTAVSG